VRKAPSERARRVLATVGVGSNLGDREAVVRSAVTCLLEGGAGRLVASSSLYETEPFGVRSQPWFLNCVVDFLTDLDLEAFFRLLQDVEKRFGRVRGPRWGPRTLDLDLLFFGDRVHEDPDLTVPHPGIPSRRFVLEPLCEIDAARVHPGLGRSVGELLEALDDPGKVIRLDRPPIGPPAP
jgi:2-amino-4-hydroxy-6-hydroxymethyldihydropteridine diphosphokinase